MTDAIDTFKKSFKTSYSSARGECNCGKEFYHPDRMSWDFEDSEIEYLEANDATELSNAVEYIELDGYEYVSECNCWHSKAERLILFLNRYNAEVAKFLNGERARKIHEAEQMQIIEILKDSDLPNHNDDDDDDDIPF